MVLGNKHVFWQALVVALIIFWTGLLLGTYFERARIDEIQGFYFDSETEIFDLNLVSDILKGNETNCEIFASQSILFADRIYAEALQLEKYDSSNKITEEAVSLHKRYDLLRVMLWKSIVENKKTCKEKINTVVYLYDYVDTPINEKAIQGTMSNFLVDLKKNKGSKIILIPIATDTGVKSLDISREIYKLEKVPVIFVNEEFKVESLDSLDKIEEHLN